MQRLDMHLRLFKAFVFVKQSTNNTSTTCSVDAVQRLSNTTLSLESIVDSRVVHTEETGKITDGRLHFFAAITCGSMTCADPGEG